MEPYYILPFAFKLEACKNFHVCLRFKHSVSIYTCLAVRARQLDSVAQLVRALHRNRRAAGIPAKGFIVAAPG